VHSTIIPLAVVCILASQTGITFLIPSNFLALHN